MRSIDSSKPGNPAVFDSNDGASAGHILAGSDDAHPGTNTSRLRRPDGEEPPRRLSLSERDRLISQHLRLVRAIAATLRPRLGRALEFDDLVGFGARGLVEAAERFDPDRHGAFSTFVYYRIRGAMLDGANRTGVFSRLEVARARAEAELEEVGSTSTDATRADDRMNRLGDILGRIATVHRDMAGDQRESITPDQAVERSELRAVVRAAVEALPPRERRFIELYYLADRSLAEVMLELGAVSKGRTWELHDRAIAALRRRLEPCRVDIIDPPAHVRSARNFAPQTPETDCDEQTPRQPLRNLRRGPRDNS